MATGFKLSDGRDLSDIFTAGDAGITVGFQTSNGTDLGRQFMGGSTGVVTGFRDPSGIDLGSRFGNGPSAASGWTKVADSWVFRRTWGDSVSFYFGGSSATNSPFSTTYVNEDLCYVAKASGNASCLWLNNTQFTFENGYCFGPINATIAAHQYLLSLWNANQKITTAWYK